MELCKYTPDIRFTDQKRFFYRVSAHNHNSIFNRVAGIKRGNGAHPYPSHGRMQSLLLSPTPHGIAEDLTSSFTTYSKEYRMISLARV